MATRSGTASTRIEDVAREAGVSTATVSRVLNHVRVNPDMKRRVEAAVEKLNYRPNYMAKGLMERKTYTVGVLVPSLSNHYFTDLVESLEERLRRENLMVLFCSTKNDPEREGEHLHNLYARSVDGVIVVNGSSENSRNSLFSSFAEKMPLVIINGDTEGLPVHNVIADQKYGTRLALDYLFELGHRRISFVRARHGFSYDVREEEYREYCTGRGVEMQEHSIIHIPYGNTEEAITMTEEAFLSVLRSNARPTAVLASNDLMAMGLVRAAEEAGLAVPSDLSIVGHDDTLVAKMGKVGLTSINIKTEAMGRSAAEMLVKVIHGEETEPHRMVFLPELVKRESCAGPPGPGRADKSEANQR